MTMRRTRHKLEPQCDQSCVQGTVQQTRTTLTTKKRDTTNKQAQGTHESSVVGLVSVHMLHRGIPGPPDGSLFIAWLAQIG